jgi:hypothetical protein
VGDADLMVDHQFGKLVTVDECDTYTLCPSHRCFERTRRSRSTRYKMTLSN